MFWVWFVVVTGTLAVVVLVTLGRANGLPESSPDAVEVDLPVDGPVRATDIQAVRLPMAARGYRMRDVDDLLDRLAAELAERDAQIERLEQNRP